MEIPDKEQRHMPTAPAHILEIVHTNPDPPTDFSGVGAATIAGGEFPLHSPQEWRQVLAPNDADYEVELVGASGWILDNKFSGGDVPFDHPFGPDWECMLAVDFPTPPSTGPNYIPLLARGNQVIEDGDVINRARNLQIPVAEGTDGAPSLLGVEIDGGILPKAFSDGAAVAEGDRMAVFGRWIVDCGHEVEVTVPTHPPATFRSEIHPPLLMASARVVTGNLASGGSNQVTRVLFTSRPYLVSQRFTTDTNAIYDDAGQDDGPFVTHFSSEVSKVHHTLFGIPLDSVLVEAHPKIKSFPFLGVQGAHFVVRPPTLAAPARPRHNAAEGVVVDGSIKPTLYVSCKFTRRSGCSVLVAPAGPDSIDVRIFLNSVGYTPFPLPNRSGRRWSKDDLNKIDSRAAWGYTWEELKAAILDVLPLVPSGTIGAEVATAILERGIETDEYDTGPVTSINILDTHDFATSPAANRSAEAGVVQDNNQPYPVFGWLELWWQSPENPSRAGFPGL